MKYLIIGPNTNTSIDAEGRALYDWHTRLSGPYEDGFAALAALSQHRALDDNPDVLRVVVGEVGRDWFVGEPTDGERSARQFASAVDLHAEMASKMFGTESPSKVQRDQSMRVAFGLLCGSKVTT